MSKSDLGAMMCLGGMPTTRTPNPLSATRLLFNTCVCLGNRTTHHSSSSQPLITSFSTPVQTSKSSAPTTQRVITYMEEENARTPALRCRQRRAAELNMVFWLGRCFLLWCCVCVGVRLVDGSARRGVGRLARRGGVTPATHFQPS